MPLFFIYLRFSSPSYSYKTFIRRHSPRFLSISSSLARSVRKTPPGVAEPRIELGPALQQADGLPPELRRNLSAPRRTLSELRRTLELYTYPEIVLLQALSSPSWRAWAYTTWRASFPAWSHPAPTLPGIRTLSCLNLWRLRLVIVFRIRIKWIRIHTACWIWIKTVAESGSGSSPRFFYDKEKIFS